MDNEKKQAIAYLLGILTGARARAYREHLDWKKTWPEEGITKGVTVYATGIDLIIEEIRAIKKPGPGERSGPGKDFEKQINR